MPAERTITIIGDKRVRKLPSGHGVRIPCEYPDCQVTVSRQSDVVRHMRTHDPHAERFPCQFEGCTHSATQAGNLRAHVASKHSGMKPEKKRRRRSTSTSESSNEGSVASSSRSIAIPRAVPATVNRTINQASSNPEEDRQRFGSFSAFPVASTSSSSHRNDSQSATSQAASSISNPDVHAFYGSYTPPPLYIPQDISGKAIANQSQGQPLAHDFSWSIDKFAELPELNFDRLYSLPATFFQPSEAPDVQYQQELVDVIPHARPAYDATGGLEFCPNVMQPVVQSQQFSFDFPQFDPALPMIPVFPPKSHSSSHTAAKSARPSQNSHEKAKQAVKRNLRRAEVKARAAASSAPIVFSPVVGLPSTPPPEEYGAFRQMDLRSFYDTIVAPSMDDFALTPDKSTLELFDNVFSPLLNQNEALPQDNFEYLFNENAFLDFEDNNSTWIDLLTSDLILPGA